MIPIPARFVMFKMVGCLFGTFIHGNKKVCVGGGGGRCKRELETDFSFVEVLPRVILCFSSTLLFASHRFWDG